jgi:predicted ATP-grasp superfamily ATP-dependent carboligase
MSNDFDSGLPQAMEVPVPRARTVPEHEPTTRNTVRRASHAAVPGTRRRALIWDGKNTSSVLTARTLRARGWRVDVILAPNCPWRGEVSFDGERTLAEEGRDDALIERTLAEHPMDALFLHGDGQVRWLLKRWEGLSPSVKRHLPEAEALERVLSKDGSARLARSLGVPVLETRRCHSPEEVEAAARELAGRGQVVLKGEGSSAGNAVRAYRACRRLSAADWAALTRLRPYVLVQRRIRGKRLFVTVVYERGVERAACAHEKVLTWPYAFGVTAVGVTRNIPEVHESVRRMFQALAWNGVANAEFRQDVEDGRWYFMEINPRVNCSIGIQEQAGIDVVDTWAAVCEGRGAELEPAPGYRSGVRYWWAVPTLALTLRRPWRVPWWGLLRRAGSDWASLDGATRMRLLRVALWSARKA